LFHRAAGLKLDSDGNVLVTGTADNDIVTVKYAQPENSVGKFNGVTATGKGLGILFDGSAGSEYRLEGSTNLVDWVSLTNLLGGPSPLKWTDHRAGNRRGGFIEP
jgi:hypothetical protein